MKKGSESNCGVIKQPQEVMDKVHTCVIRKHTHTQTLVQSLSNLHTEHAQNDGHVYMFLLHCDSPTLACYVVARGYVDDVIKYRDVFKQLNETSVVVYQSNAEYP